MITLLSRLFIGKNPDFNQGAVRIAFGKLCSILGIVLNILLFALKFVIGIFAGAISVLADAYNNLSDALSSVLGLLGFKLAAKKPSDERPFGHGRTEYVAGLVISIIIIVVGVNVFRDSLTGIVDNTQVKPSYTQPLYLILLGVSVLVKAYMVFYNYKIGKKINSTAMKAVAGESIMDVISSLLVVGCAVLYRFTGVDLDNWCGLVISVLLCYTGIKAAKDTIGDLLGKRPDPSLVEKVYQIVLAYDRILGVHDLVIHDYGPDRKMISLHAEVSGDEDVYELHEVIDSAMNELDLKLNCVSVIHLDPVCVNDEELTLYRVKTQELLKQIDNGITLHDFRAIKKDGQKQLLFSAVLPHGIKLTDNEARERITDLVTQSFDGFTVKVKIEKSYI
ncbi:MAG: cation transporter [Clostridia bacterium]|nr:cation transporter [Clostridia bacterium]